MVFNIEEDSIGTFTFIRSFSCSFQISFHDNSTKHIFQSAETQPPPAQTATTSPDISVELLPKTEDEIVDNEVEDLGSMSSPEVLEHPPLPFHHQELLHGNCLFKEENVKEVHIKLNV